MKKRIISIVVVVAFILVQDKHTPNAHTYRITTYLLLID